MNLRISLLFATGAAALLGTASAEQSTRSPKAQQELAKALAGRVAGAAGRLHQRFPQPGQDDGDRR